MSKYFKMYLNADRRDNIRNLIFINQHKQGNLSCYKLRDLKVNFLISFYNLLGNYQLNF